MTLAQSQPITPSQRDFMAEHKARQKRIAARAFRRTEPAVVKVDPPPALAPEPDVIPLQDQLRRIWSALSESNASHGRIEMIQRVTAHYFGLTRADLCSPCRTLTVVRPRQIAVYLAKTMTPRSLPEIGRKFGGRDHTTILHAIRKIEQLQKTDAKIASAIDAIRDALTVSER